MVKTKKRKKAFKVTKKQEQLKIILFFIVIIISLFSLTVGIINLVGKPIDLVVESYEEETIETFPYKLINPKEIKLGSKLFNPILPEVIFRGNPEIKKVALTIDDGYNIDERLLDLLDAYNIKCTVFLVGDFVEKFPLIVVRMDKMGFEICCHTYSHRKYLQNYSKEEAIKEVLKGQIAITRITKKVYPYFRPPWGEYSNDNVRAFAKEGFKVIMWSNGIGGYKVEDSVDNQINRVMSDLKNGDIILLHFGTYYVYDVMIKLIPLILDEGYEFITISEMISLMR